MNLSLCIGGQVRKSYCLACIFLKRDDYGTLFFLHSNFKWQRAWGKPVLDRVGLIIEIFNAHAQTKEAKLQVLL